MAVNVNQILPPIPYSSNDERLIPSTQIEATFNPNTDYIEYVVSTINNSFQTVDYSYNTYSFPTDGTVVSNNINSIEIDPTSDLSRKGITSGDYNVYYNFYRNYLQSSPTNQNLFIKEILAQQLSTTYRTEICYILLFYWPLFLHIVQAHSSSQPREPGKNY